MALYSTLQKFITKEGAPVEGASVNVKLSGGAVDAELFATRTGTYKSNPFLTTANGEAICYVKAGRYDMTVTKGTDQIVFKDIEVGPVSNVGTFAEGGTITDPDQLVEDADGNKWRWTGNLNYTYAESENPESTDEWVKYINGKHSPEIALLEQWGYNYKGTFAKGFTYSQEKDAGIDENGKAWIYVGAGAPNKVVSVGTVPSVGSGYEQVAFNIDTRKYVYNVSSVSDIINISDSLSVGSTLITAGRFNAGDGGGASWIINPVPSVANGYDAIAMAGGKVAVLHTDGSVKLRQLGAKSDGLTDIRDVLMFASANYSNIEDSGGSYITSGLVDIRDNQLWDLKNTTIKAATDSVHIFRAKGVNGWELRGNVLLLGSSADPTASDNGSRGITIENCLRYRVSDLEASNFSGKGVQVLGNIQPPINSETGQFSNIRSFNCYESVDLTQGNAGEYTTWSNTQIGASRRGLLITSGNTGFHGGGVTNCLEDGLVILRGGNSAHGMITGMHLNHSLANNLRVEDINNGFTFQGCHTYANNNVGSGKVVINNSVGVNWNGGIIDSWIQVDESLGKVGYNQISNVFCPGGLGGIKLFDENNDRPKGVIVNNCFGEGVKNTVAGSATINDAGQCYVNARKLPSNPQTLTPNAVTTLVFDNVLNLGDNRRAYNKSTGEFTCPAQMDGQYNIRANCIFQGVSLDLANTYVDMLINGVSSGFFYASTESAVSGETISVQISSDVYLDSGDIVKLGARIGSSSAKFGAVSLSNLTISKIA